MSEKFQIKFLDWKAEISGSLKVTRMHTILIHKNFAQFIDIHWRWRNMINVSFYFRRMDLDFIVKMFQLLVINKSRLLHIFLLISSHSSLLSRLLVIRTWRALKTSSFIQSFLWFLWIILLGVFRNLFQISLIILIFFSLQFLVKYIFILSI